VDTPKGVGPQPRRARSAKTNTDPPGRPPDWTRRCSGVQSGWPSRAAFRQFQYPTSPLSRPGGAQAELLSEVNKHETDRNLDLVLAEFHNYQQGNLPAGPGARSLTAFFASIDAEISAASETAPKIQHNDRDILNLLTKRAKVLHLGTCARLVNDRFALSRGSPRLRAACSHVPAVVVYQGGE
jgi:hypothetical protein